jgi:hypothetical protein
VLKTFPGVTLVLLLLKLTVLGSLPWLVVFVPVMVFPGVILAGLLIGGIWLGLVWVAAGSAGRDKVRDAIAEARRVVKP